MKNYKNTLRLIVSASVISLFAFGTLLLSSCSPTEVTRNTFNDKWQLVASAPSGVVAYSMPDGAITNSSVWLPETDALYSTSQVRDYRNSVYVLRKDAPAIIVISRDLLVPTDTIETTSYGVVRDIAFANATTAYATTDSSGVIVIDLISNTVALAIPLNELAAGIAVIGNQLCVTLPEKQQCVIIDTRTNSVEATINLPTPYPYYVAGDGINEVFCIVAFGDGKILGSTKPLTTPTVSFVSMFSRKVLKTLDVTSRASEGPTQIPTGVAVSSTEYVYIPVQNALMRASTRTMSKTSAIQFESFSAIYYNAARAEIVCVSADGRTIKTFDEFAEINKSTTSFSDSLRHFIGIAP